MFSYNDLFHFAEEFANKNSGGPGGPPLPSSSPSPLVPRPLAWRGDQTNNPIIDQVPLKNDARTSQPSQPSQIPQSSQPSSQPSQPSQPSSSTNTMVDPLPPTETFSDSHLRLCIKSQQAPQIGNFYV